MIKEKSLRYYATVPLLRKIPQSLRDSSLIKGANLIAPFNKGGTPKGWGNLPSFILGALLVLAFSPFNVWILGLFIPALLFFQVQRQTPKIAFWRGFAFGVGEFGFGTSWIYVSLAHYGNGSLMAFIITLLFTLILALFPAVQCWLLQRYFWRQNDAVRLLLIYPILWVGGELIRSSIFTGFPWLLLGYTQTFTALAGYAKVGAVFLVSGLTVFVSGLICFGVFRRFIRRVIWIVIVCVGGNALLHHSFTRPIGPPLQVALVQGNISENEKWQRDSVPNILNAYVNLSGPILNTALIVWPENAITVFPEQVMSFIDSLDMNADHFKSAIVFGIPIDNTLNHTYFNGALAVGDASGMYLKQHLVPFGEYLPLPQVFGWLFSTFDIPMSTFSKGPMNPYPMQIHGLPVRVFICYESAYPFLFRQAADSDYIITLSDDAWFGDSLGPYQHEEMEVMRAIETGRPILRATNTGITSIIDQNGKVLAKAPMFTPFVLKGSIQPVAGETPWLRI